MQKARVGVETECGARGFVSGAGNKSLLTRPSRAGQRVSWLGALAAHLSAQLAMTQDVSLKGPYTWFSL